MILVGQLTRQVRSKVVLINPLTSLQILAGMTDGITVFDDVFAFLCVTDEHLMSYGNIFQQGDLLMIHLNGFPLVHRAQTDDDGVGRVDSDGS